jgi:hypothetical protein
VHSGCQTGLGSPAVGIGQEGHQRANGPGDADVHRRIRRQDAVCALQPVEVEAQRHRQQLQSITVCMSVVNTCITTAHVRVDEVQDPINQQNQA